MFDQAFWIIPGSLLLVVAWVKFNNPPTNRSGTTFFLFHLGVIFYFALLVGLWFFVIVMLRGGAAGLGEVTKAVQLSLKSSSETSEFVPVLAALIIAVASQFPKVKKLDVAARQLCISLAAIPRQAEQLGAELAQRSEFKAQDPALSSRVSREISEGIGKKALNFEDDGTMASRFTRAISLYWLFVAPYHEGTPVAFPSNVNSRSAYAKTMGLHGKVASQCATVYRDMMITALAYFTAVKATQDVEDSLNRHMQQLANLVCSLISRYVLILDKGARQRRKRLSAMGFGGEDGLPPLGRDQWVAIILVIFAFFMFMSVLVPTHDRPPFVEKLSLSVMIVLQLAIAAIAATWVARRFIESNDGIPARFPPIAELTFAGLVVVGLCACLRISWPLLVSLLAGHLISVDAAVAIFREKWAWIFLPFICTLSIGLICSYLGTRDWTRLRQSTVGAMCNGLAFAVGGLLIGQLLSVDTLTRINEQPQMARLIILAGTGMVGAVIGALVLAMFHKAFLWRVERRGIEKAYVHMDMNDCVVAESEFSRPRSQTGTASSTCARQELGSYLQSNVADLEGRYVCFRPTFSNPAIINAYLITIRWDQSRVSLVFEEESRYDKAHVQNGQIYLPGDKPFMSLVTVDKGAVRVILVTRPDALGLGRGLILTLSNPEGVHFIPATAPIVLRRIEGELPQLGFVHAGTPDYDLYMSQIGSVTPGYGISASAGAAHGEPGRLAVVK